MINVDEAMACFKAFAETEKGKRKINEFVQRIEEEERRKKAMIETDYYIKWLEEFTEKYPRFTDSTWLYHSDKISEKDNENVGNLDEFFNIIEEFADKHYIPYIHCENGASYYIKYNEKIYEIGVIVGQGAICFCNTVDNASNAFVINFEELSKPSDKTLVRTSQIENQLHRIDDLLKELGSSSLNIPIYAIGDRVTKVLEHLSENK